MNIVFLGTTVNYGHKFVAANKKTELLAKGLKACGNDITIHNGLLGVREIDTDECFEEPQIGKIINYASSGPRVLDPIKNYSRLKEDLKKLKKVSENILILLAPYNPIYEEQLLIGKQLGYKIVVISHEWLPTLNHRNFAERLMRELYSLSFGYGVDAILPISDYIKQRVIRFNKPLFKTPILGEFEEAYEKRIRKSGFIYCGTTAYERAFMILIEAYQIYCDKISEPLPLTFILSGNDISISKVKTKIASKRINNITVMSGLPYEDLYSLYRSASGLLLPLDPNNEQDKARFSQKIAEYVSMGTLLISNPVGEINNYFIHGENAILNTFSPEGFAESMEWVTKHPSEVERIAKAGWNTGKQEFDCFKFGEKLNEFFKLL